MWRILTKIPKIFDVMSQILALLQEMLTLIQISRSIIALPLIVLTQNKNMESKSLIKSKQTSLISILNFYSYHILYYFKLNKYYIFIDLHRQPENCIQLVDQYNEEYKIKFSELNQRVETIQENLNPVRLLFIIFSIIHLDTF